MNGQSNPVTSYRRLTALILSLLLFLLFTEHAPGAQAQDPEYAWSPPENLSQTPNGSWFSDMVIDSHGNIHVIWCETVRPESGLFLEESINYTVWNGEEWSQPNDLVADNPDINRNALAIDGSDRLYMVYRHGVSGGIGIVFRSAWAEEARSAAAWSRPHRLDLQGNAYMPAMTIDSQGLLHLLFEDRGNPESTICLGGCSDLYYRKSKDQGDTWTFPVNLSNTSVGSTRVQIQVDLQDTIYATWDEGWDRVSGVGEAVSGSFTYSTDGGETWSPVLSISYPDSTVAQLTAGSDKQNGVLLVWRATSSDPIYYQWSNDGGETFEAPAEIPGIWARPWTTRFDLFNMATDSAGQIHLLVVGRESQEADADLGVYHLVWDGETWSKPTSLFSAPGLYPEYPKIVIHEGNQLHATWFSREGSEYDQEVNREIWYSKSQSAAPRIEVTPVPSPTPKPPTPTPSPPATATPFPTLSLQDSGLPEGLYSETDDIQRLLIALLPVIALITGIFLFIKRGWLRRFFG